jgi:membrane protease YdiL (CAAX protease family)
MIVPIAEKLTGVTVDLSQVEAIQGDPATLGIWLAQALALAAFGEELVFRGYLMNRVADLFGKKRLGLVVGLLISSVGFGWAHRYQGDAGMVATGLIGVLLALLYLRTRNLWSVIICHAVVDLTALIVIYYGHKTWLFS